MRSWRESVMRRGRPCRRARSNLPLWCLDLHKLVRLTWIAGKEWPPSNFSLQYHWWIKRWSHENNGNDQELQNVQLDYFWSVFNSRHFTANFWLTSVCTIRKLHSFFYGYYFDKCDCQRGKRFTVGVPSMRISDAPSLRCVASQDFFKIIVVRGLIITETYASILYKVDHFETPKISQGLVFLFYVAQIVR